MVQRNRAYLQVSIKPEVQKNSSPLPSPSETSTRQEEPSTNPALHLMCKSTQNGFALSALHTPGWWFGRPIEIESQTHVACKGFMPPIFRFFINALPSSWLYRTLWTGPAPARQVITVFCLTRWIYFWTGCFGEERLELHKLSNRGGNSGQPELKVY